MSQKEPARIIKVTQRSVSGIVPDMGQYESTLERDFMQMLRFDKSVESFQAQPITITYTDSAGAVRSYTPDGMIIFKPSLQIPQTLYEIKFRDDFRKDWKNLIPKFRAVKKFCLDNFWRFSVFTEREIRTAYLENIKFLWPYRERVVDEEMKRHVLQIVEDLDETDPDMLLCALCRDQENRGYMIPVIWHLVAHGEIGCDLDLPLSMRSKLWCKGVELE